MKIEEGRQSSFYEALTSVNHYAIFLVSRDGLICTWNAGAERLSGLPESKAVGKTPDEIFKTSSLKTFSLAALLDTAMKYGSALDDAWITNTNSSRFNVRISITSNYKLPDELTSFIVIIHPLATGASPISDELTSHYTKIVDEVQDYAILLLDLSGYIKYANLGVTKIKRYSQSELLNEHFRIFYPADERTSMLPEHLLAEALLNDKVYHEGWRLRKDGTQFWGSVVITALHNKENTIIGYSKVTRDLTEKKLAEESKELYVKQLEKGAKEMEELAYIVSHDLQEPIRTIRSFIDLFETRFRADMEEDAKTYIGIIKQSAERMQQLIVGILEYAVIGRHREKDMVDLNHVLVSVKQDLDQSIRSSNTAIISHELPLVYGHVTELRQLFQNLISNAIKFSKSDISPEITVTVTPSGGEWIFQIQDNGIGFDSKFSEKIFMLFKRLHRQEKYSGIGIGLSYSKKIVELHDGRIWAKSEAGTGTSIYFTLPQIKVHEEQ